MGIPGLLGSRPQPKLGVTSHESCLELVIVCCRLQMSGCVTRLGRTIWHRLQVTATVLASLSYRIGDA
jgi:hypothetical protein